ncbi:flavin-containing monooxygenase [Sphingomonas aracearum]|uniref:NAD(P)/FAD-dependent oxidoreductase n=1 Tax=Sphingomonas aracearum TaxID=2283317 RepID=A0A369VSB3_9SPHN|nr:NAD(P)/FAD-dependent oxidoreductase [Sphingomonas aracearum]RDE05284.1 NAD(P)/FAD-dependent oxidoreductase [Sphingomonas aracearum]
MTVQHFDVIVVGAGLSGIGAGYHLKTRCPDCSFVLLESRAALGGTWDLFRYPGIRSDSDMHTLGYSFRPWTEAKAIADGASIRRYVEETAREHGIDAHIRYQHRVIAAAWSTAEARWTVTVDTPEGLVELTCGFLFFCSGYYDYARGHAPVFAGAEDFAGRIVHPQFWPDDLDLAGRQVVVIGSGATAVTLVPELARAGARVTMLQRSPTYVVSRPSEDGVANWLRARLPQRLAYRLTRLKNVALSMFFYRLARRRPAQVAKRIIAMAQEALGPDYDVETHFTPHYKPWDQRVCLVPDADLFTAVCEGRARVVTDTIDRFVPQGVRVSTGEVLAADVIVTATGLELQLLGGATLCVDGDKVNLAERFNYKGMMFSGVPNMASCFGYTNASWTLKADLTCAYVCRLLNTMRRRGLRQATPRPGTATMRPMPLLDFTSGYVKRAEHLLPRQADRAPWRVNQNYALDLLSLRLGSVDREMDFSNPA